MNHYLLTSITKKNMDNWAKNNKTSNIKLDIFQTRNVNILKLFIYNHIKFLKSLNEFIVHLIPSYIYFFSNKKINSNSFKEENDKDDKGFFFEKKLNGKERFEFLNINTIITLLDGVSCQKNLSDFQVYLNAEINLDKIKKRAKEREFKGFLQVFLEKHPINFEFFQKRKKTPMISCQEQGGIGIFMTRYESDTYGGGPARKK